MRRDSARTLALRGGCQGRAIRPVARAIDQTRAVRTVESRTVCAWREACARRGTSDAAREESVREDATMARPTKPSGASEPEVRRSEHVGASNGEIAAAIRHALGEALERQAMREARHVAIDVDDGVVTVSGCVRSLSERRAVIGAVSAIHGVAAVNDRLTIDRTT
jgi:osmotically-inducible protein OsmY